MQDQAATSRLMVNPKHRRQVFWQILAPLIVTLLLVVSSAVLAVVLSTSTTRPTTGQLAAISVIWMILPLIPVGLLFLFVTIGLIYLTARILHFVPVYSRLSLLYVQIFGVRIGHLMDRLARPFILVGGSAAGWRAIWRRRKL